MRAWRTIVNSHSLGYKGRQPLGPLGTSAEELTGPVPKEDYSRESFDFIRTKINSCLEGHANCKQQRYWPRRLIDVRPPIAGLDGDGVRLVESTVDFEGQYIALSHCWGKTRMLTSTIETKAQRMAGIPIHQLSRTFQDSVIFARELCVRYLWIDSLCIIQDDAEDWAVQSSEMAQVYSGSIITVAASSATDGSSGLFAKRMPMSHLVEVPDPDDPDSCFRVLFALNNNQGYRRGYADLDRLHEMYEPWSSEKDVLPLLRRAWTFQERLLSTRIVHFTPSELLFECKEELNCQCSTKSKLPLHKTAFEHIRVSSVSVCGTGGKDATHSVVKTHPAVEWERMITFYTSLQLTYPRDMFSALSGLAQEVSRKAQEQGYALGPYCAGLWGNYLSSGLCWQTGPYTQTHDTYYAPSWSWASRRGIFYGGMLGPDDGFQLVSNNVVPKGPNPHGEVQEGSSIVVRANIVPAIELGDVYEDGYSADWGYVRYELPSTTGVIDLKGSDREDFGFHLMGGDLGLWLALDVEYFAEVSTDEVLDYYCIELRRSFPMLKRGASPVVEVQGILVNKTPTTSSPSESAYMRDGVFYYRGPGTIFGYSFDAEKYRRTRRRGDSYMENLRRYEDAWTQDKEYSLITLV